MQIHWTGAAGALATLVFLAGCGPGGQSAGLRQGSSAAGAVDPARYDPNKGPLAPGVAAPASAVGGSGAGAVTVGAPLTPFIERSVTAAYTVPSGSFLASFDGVTARAVAIGGYVVSSSTQPDDAGRMVGGSVSVKIPAPKIADFLNDMPSAFTASSINFGSIDHTAAFIDLNARVGTSRAHLAALNNLLNKATSLADITNLQQQIATVQTELDTYQGQLNVLTASVDLTTATIDLHERGFAAAPPNPANPVTSGIGGGWSNAVHVTGAVLEAAVSSLPLLVLAVLAWLLWQRGFPPVVRRRRPVA